METPQEPASVPVPAETPADGITEHLGIARGDGTIADRAHARGERFFAPRVLARFDQTRGLHALRTALVRIARVARALVVPPGGMGRVRRVALSLAAMAALFAWIVAVVLGSTIQVNDTRDAADTNPGDGTCRSALNTCTLRAAIMEANAQPGANRIVLPAGVYAIGIPTTNDDLDTTGDLDIHGPVVIEGDGPTASIIDGGFPLPGADPRARGMDRLLEVHPTAGNVTIDSVTLREGYTDGDGPALTNWSPGLLTLRNVHVRDNYASGAGGVFNADPINYEWLVEPLIYPKSGRIEIYDSLFTGNASGAGGAAISNQTTGMISILAGTRVVDNPGEMVINPNDPPEPFSIGAPSMIPAAGVYDPAAPAISNMAFTDKAGTIRIVDSTVADNFSRTEGGGVINAGDGTLEVIDSTISGNVSQANGGGIHTDGGTLVVDGSTVVENQAANGGGVYSAGSVDTIGLRPKVTITNSTVTKNHSYAGGGGIYSAGEAVVTIRDTTVSLNHANDAGGGLANHGRASMIVTRATFLDNEAYGEGGGAWTASARLVTFSDSTFQGNDAGVPTPEELINPAGANIAGGGGLYTETGPVTITGSTFTKNTATEEGGGLSMDNHGDIRISDSAFSYNHSAENGGGLENSATRVTFERNLVTNNRAEHEGGGIYNSSSGEFTILDTTVQLNNAASGGGLANAPDNTLVIRNSSFLRNTARHPSLTEDGDLEEAGYGGAILSKADGNSLIENTTISGNIAAIGGGGLFHDADGIIELNHLTFWRNAARQGGAIGVVESDFSPSVPPKPNIAVQIRNSIIGGSVRGGSCDSFITTLGGNLDTGGTQEANVILEGPVLPTDSRCFVQNPPDSNTLPTDGRDRFSSAFTVDALADNGGHTLTHALQEGSLAVDGGVNPCPEKDQRGVARPQNGVCDIGAYEYVGEPAPPDDVSPIAQYLTGPIQDSLVSVAFTFTGSDNVTATEDLLFECRLIEHDPTEPPEPIAPWDPIPVELWWNSCTSPWNAPLLEEGVFEFQVRAIDRAGNVSAPDIHLIGGADTSPPETSIVEKPGQVVPGVPYPVSQSRSATFTFTAVDNLTPVQFMEFECRLDSKDPELWLECLNPTLFSNLTTGEHTLEVRAYDGAENVDPTPARYTWIVGTLPGCNAANITLTPAADGWVDEVSPIENYLFETELTVRSGATDPGNGNLIGENARAFFRFDLTPELAVCDLESATLKLYNASPGAGRALQAVPIATSWKESTLTWMSQPSTAAGATAAEAEVTGSTEGYVEWDVTQHVLGMLDSGVNNGWMIRDANETDLQGLEQAFISREMPQDPPPTTLPVLVLRFVADDGPPPPPPTPATVPTTVFCGQVITQSTVVANDLTGCMGEGLVVGADNLVLDLNGHTITSGALIEPGEEDGLLAGIRVSGHSNVVVRNGTVSGFGHGVHLTSGTIFTVVRDMTLDGNILAGVTLWDADDGRTGNTIRSNHIENNGEAGIAIQFGSENSLIEDNTLLSNGGGSIHLLEADGHRIQGNQLSGVSLNPLVGSDAGIMLEASSDNVIVDNQVSDFGDGAVFVDVGSHRNRVEANGLFRNGDAGVLVHASNGTVVVDNVVYGNSDAAVTVSAADDTTILGNDLRFNPSGVDASEVNGLLIEGNDVSDSLQGGIAVGNGVDVRIIGNTANRTGGFGIELAAAAFDIAGNAVGQGVLDGNIANENAATGIVVANGGHTIRNNAAHNNAGHGILAAEAGDPTGANIDGGGNVASGNAHPEQCVGVVCDPGVAPALTPLDITAPETEIVDAPPNPSNGLSATFTFKGTDNVTPAEALSFECRLDADADPVPEVVEPGDLEPPDLNNPEPPDSLPEGVGWFECRSPVQFNGLEQGLHRFEVRALDLGDLFDTTPAVYEWDVDITAPDEDALNTGTAPNTRIVTSPSAPSVSTDATFTFAGSDDTTPGLALTFECQIDGGGWSTCATPKTYAGLSLTSHTFEVRAIDRHLNADPTPASYTWTINALPPDTTPPDTTILSAPDEVTIETSATFTFTSNETEATFECSIDGGATFTTCASPQTYSGLSVGVRDFLVRAVDGAGNLDSSPALYRWKVAPAPVPTTIFCGQVITFSIKVNNDIAECEWDGLVVGASDITIDLNGKTIDGKGLAAGIRVDGYDNVTIRNGIIREYDFGVMLNPGAASNVVEEVGFELNQEAAISLGVVPHPTDPLQPPPGSPPPQFRSGTNDNIVRNNHIVANDLAVWITNGSRDNVVHDNSLSANAKGGIRVERASGNRIESNEMAASSSAAVTLSGAEDNLVIGNTIVETGGGVLIEWTYVGTPGIPSRGNRIENNVVEGTNAPAFEIDHSEENELVGNVAFGSNGEALLLYYATDNLILDNDFSRNKSGIQFLASTGNRLEGNDASHSESTGIKLESGSGDNEIVANISNDNIGDGIYVGDETVTGGGSLIDRNTTNNNNGYGIYVPKVSHIISNNRAYDNGGWGIWVSDGSNGRFNFDGGGNVALGNQGPLDPITLKPQQCWVVRCEGGSAPQSDLIHPDTVVMQGPEAITADPFAFFRFTGSDNIAVNYFECRLDESAWAQCNSPYTATVGAGTHTFEVRAADLALNVDLSPATHTWEVVDAPPGAPETTITSGPDLTTVETSASFTFVASEAGSTFECSLDGAAFVVCTSSQSYINLAVGSHSFQVRATDSGADTDASPATYAWTVSAAPVPSTVGCGEIIVKSTLVLNDIDNCAGIGLIVGANGITIDLDGHYIDGLGLDTGILNNGFDSVTIRNGTIHEFEFGVLLNPGASLNIVEDLRLELNAQAGVALSDADQGGQGSIVRNNTIVSNEIGIGVFSNTSFAHIHDNRIAFNNADGIRLDFAVQSLVENNEIRDSRANGIVMEGGTGHVVLGNLLRNNLGPAIAVGEDLIPSTNVRVESNEIDGGAGGILVNLSDGTHVLYNSVVNTTGAGITLELSDNAVIRGNEVRGNQAAIAVEEARNNLIEANNSSGNLGDGIEIGTLSYSNVVRLNSSNVNGGDGISIEDSALAGQGNLLDRNTTDSNGGDGIAVFGVGHTIVGNTARLNGGWGIYAAAGATDGGGNFAAGNLEPAQCFNVVCTLGTIPGAPETWIVEGPFDVDLGTPGIQTNSRNASFTYNASSPVNTIFELTFECRFDTTNDLAWEDCQYPAEYLNLSGGKHVFEVRALDLQLRADPTPARFEFQYVPLPAGVAPDVTLDMVPPAETWMTDAVFTFHANEPDVTFECRYDFFGWEPCGFAEPASFMSRGAYEVSLDETQVGSHTFSVRAMDFEGNVGEPATYTWKLLGVSVIFLSGPGFTPGETPLDPATGGETREATATIDFISNVADASYLCSLDLEPFAPCNPPVTYTGLIPGSHELRVLATDLSNGVEAADASVYEWEIVDPVDTAPPDTSIEFAPASNSSSTVFHFTGTDDLTPPAQLVFECRVDSTNELDWFECLSPFNLLDVYTYLDPQMAPGEHTFEVRARDAAEPLDPNAPQDGNADPTPASYTWTMIADTTSPGTGILSGPPDTVGQGEIVFEFFGSDNATPILQLTFECALDLAPFEPCTSPETLGGLEPGTHTFKVRAVDLAGNVDPTPSAQTFTVVAAPVTTISSGPAGRIVDGAPPATPSTTESATFVFSSNQAGSTFECSIDGGDFVRCVSPRALFVDSDGVHVFRVRATNPEAVVEEPPAEYAWLVALGPDTTPPNTTITSAPSLVSRTTSATFSFTGTDNRTFAVELAFECSLDGAAFGGCNAPVEYQNLVRGSHTFHVRARDAAGNVDPTPATYAWTVEGPPVSTITSGPTDPTEETSATFTFVSDTPGATFICWMDGVMEDPCASPKTYTGLAAGEHLFAVIGRAPAGTLELDWVEYEWMVGDLTPPITTIASGPDLQSAATSATFVFTANEAGVTFYCSLDGAEPLPCTSPVQYPVLWPGAHTFEVYALSPLMIDQFGFPVEPLVEPVVTTYTWTLVDQLPPDTIITFGPAATTASTTAWFGFGTDDPFAIVECSLDGAAFGACESPSEFTGLLPGTHTLLARGVDVGGNVDLTPASYTWTVVQAEPNTPVGTNVVVEVPLQGGGVATITFLEVTLAGATTADVLAGGPPLPAGYLMAGGTFYDISTTAEGEPASVCIPYDATAFGGAARLLHYDGAWIDVTSVSNPDANGPNQGVVCGLPEGLSPFAVAASSGLTPLASIISGPPNPSFSNSATFTFWTDPGNATLCSIDGLPFRMCTSPVTYHYLEPGGNEFMVTAIGPDGQQQVVPTLYEWEVILPPDTTPPNTTITKAPPALSVNPIAMFEFAGLDDQTAPIDLEFECSLDGGPFEGCETPEEFEVLTNGQHSVAVRALDATGNADPTPATWTWTIASFAAPDTSIDLGPEEETTATSAVFEFTGQMETGEIVTTFECSLDNAEFSPCTTPYELIGLAAGPHVLQVRAVSLVGMADPSPDFWAWIVVGPGTDTTPPETSIVFGPSTALSGPDVTFGFLANEPVEGFECAVDSGPYEGCESILVLENLATGQHTLLVRAVDLATPPNVDPTPASYTWNTVGHPDTTVLSGPPNPAGGNAATFTFESNQDDIPGIEIVFECAVNGSSWVPCTSPFLAGPLAEGSHTFEVRARNQFVDIAGLPVVDETPAIYEWEIADVVPPDTTIVSVAFLGPLDLVEPSTYRFEITGEDNRTVFFELDFECSLDGGPWESCDFPYHYIPLEELTSGEHSLAVRAIDELGNVDPTPAAVVFTTEGEPETTILSGPAVEVDSSDATFTFSSDQAGATFECSLDLAPYTACTSPVTFTDLGYGDHQVLVRAISPLGTQVDLTPAEHTWTSGDLTPPSVEILSGPAVVTASTSATFEFVSSEPGHLFQCTLDTIANPFFCTSPLTLESIPAGTRTFAVVAFSEHFLVEPLADEWTWTIQDATPPDTTILVGPPAEIGLGTAAEFVFESTEAGSTFECSLDGGVAFTQCASAPTNAASFNLEAGTYTLLVRAVDPTLNPDPTPASWTFTVVGPPITTILSGPDETTVDPTAVVHFAANQSGVSFGCSLDGSGFEACSSPVSYVNLLPGDHAVEIRATNGFGLVEEPPALHEWTLVDGIAPETSIDAGPPASTESTSATLVFSASEAHADFECSLDGADFAGCASPLALSGLAVGPHTFAVRAIDAAGNADPTPAEHAWTILPPPPPNTAAGTDVSVEVDVPGIGTATLTFASVTAEGITTVEALASAPALPDGYLSLGATYYDISTTAGYTGPVTVCLPYETGAPADPVRLLHYEGAAWADITTTNDTAALIVCGEASELSPFAIGTGTAPVVPETTIEVGPPAETVHTTAVFHFTSNDPFAIFECSLDDPGSWGSCVPTEEFTGLLPGTHELSVRAKNQAGTLDATPATWTWTVVSLDTTITSGPEEATESRTATFTFESDFAGATFECQLDDELTWSPCTSPLTYTELIADEHTIRVRAVGLDGVDETPAEYEWEVGFIPPSVTIESGPADPTESQTATFAFTAPGDGLVFECRLDGGDWSPCASPKTYQGVPFGPHLFEVRVFSLAAIVDAPIATYAWTVADETDPETTLTGFPGTVTGLDEATFEFASSEAESTFECALDGAAFEPCQSPQSYSGLAAGERTFAVRAVDVSGNADPTPATYSWIVAPPPAITSLEAVTSEDSPDVTFTFTADQADVTFACSLDQSLFAPCSSPHGYTGLGDGEHLFQVVATNAHGIPSVEAEVFEFAIEAAPPETTIFAGPPATTTSTTATINFSSNEAESTFTCWLDGTLLAPEGECLPPVTLSGLAAGSHQFEVAATDNAGKTDPTPATRTWTVVDETAPETTILGSPPASATSSSATFEFASSEAGSTFECSLDGAAFEPCDSPHTYTGLADGSHEFRVRAVDSSANADPTPATYTWTIAVPDTTAPETTITSTPVPPSYSTASFGYSGSDDTTPFFALSFECSLDGAPFTACPAGGITYTDLALGEHIFAVRAIDVAGNADQTPATHTWTVTAEDVTPPDTTITAGPEETTIETSATFEFTSSEAGSTFACSLDGAAMSPCASPATYADLAPGDHTFAVRATDPAGNADPSADTWEWTIVVADTTAPETTILTGPAATTTETSATIHFEGSDGTTGSFGLTYECRLESDLASPWQPCSSPASWSGLVLGEHTFEVRATDAAGNTDATPASHSWTIVELADTTAPETTIDSGFNDMTTLETSATFEFSSNEPGSTFECSLDFEAWEACTSPTTYTVLGAGTHTIRIRATDPAGNVDESPASRTWTVDLPPETILGARPADPTALTTAVFTFSSSEESSTFECALDGDSFSSCSSPATYEGLAEGSHEFRVRAKDPSGNLDLTPISYSWTVLPAPQTTIDGGPDGTTESTTATFTFSSDQDGSTFECALDVDVFSPCSSPVTYAGLGLGEHDFAVRAVGPAGNVDQTPAEYRWEIGHLTAPVVGILSGPDSLTTSREATFTFTVDDPDAVTLCSLDGATAILCTSPATYTNLPFGEHTFELTATKHHLLVDVEPATYTWTIEDVTPPETSITAGPAGATDGTDAVFEFSGTDDGTAAADLTFECSLDGVAFQGCSSPVEHSDLSPGDHRFEVRAIDEAGNVDPTPAGRDWTVANTLPGTNVSVAAQAANGETVTLGFAEVTAAGQTTVLVLETAPALPATYLELGTVYYDVETTADFAGSIEICISYDPAAFDAPADLRLLHHEAGAWSDVTTSNDTSLGILCGSVTSLSPFAVAAPAASDQTAPGTTIDGGPSSPTTDTTATIAFSADEAGATFECRLDGGAWAACSSPAELSGLAAGEHTFDVRATDAAGNTDASPATHTWTVVAPATDCTTPIELAATADSWIDQSAPNTNKGADTRLNVRARSSATYRSLVGFPLPAVPAGCEVASATLQLYASSATNGRTIEVLSLADAWTETTVRWSNQPATTGAVATSTSGTGLRTWDVTAQVSAQLAAGVSHGFLVRDSAEQSGANRLQTFNSREATANAPRLIVTLREILPPAPSVEGSGGGGPVVKGNPSAAGSTAVGAGPSPTPSSSPSPSPTPTPEPTPEPTPAPTPTPEPTPADTTPPDTTIASGPESTTAETSATFEFSSSEADSTFECSVDEAEFATCPSPAHYVDVAAGEHVFRVRAIDAAGNRDETPATHAWSVTQPDTAAGMLAGWPGHGSPPAALLAERSQPPLLAVLLAILVVTSIALLVQPARRPVLVAIAPGRRRAATG